MSGVMQVSFSGLVPLWVIIKFCGIIPEDMNEGRLITTGHSYPCLCESSEFNEVCPSDMSGADYLSRAAAFLAAL